MLFVYYCPIACPHVVHPPPYVTYCWVMLCAPSHLKHGTPISLLSLLSLVCVRKFSCFFWREAVMIYIFCDHFHPASLQKLCVGNAAHPPTIPKRKTTCFHANTHTHTHRNINPIMCLIPALSHPYSETHSFETHTPTNPSQFLQIPTGLIPPSRAARKHPQCFWGNMPWNGSTNLKKTRRQSDIRNPELQNAEI